MAYPQGEIRVPGVAERGAHTQHFAVNTGLFGYAAADALFTAFRTPPGGLERQAVLAVMPQ
jgi:hypothetical protein